MSITIQLWDCVKIELERPIPITETTTTKSIVKASCKFEHLKELKRCAKTVEIILETLALHENRNEPQEFQYFKRYNTTLRLRVTKSPSPLTFVPLMVIKVTMVAHLYLSCSV